MENDFSLKYPHNSYPRETPCSALTAAGVYRGIFIGGAYGLYFGTLELLTATTYNKDLLKSVGKNAFVATGGLACVLGIYSGTECTAKFIRGRKDFWNSAIAGFTTGGFIGYASTKSVVGALPFAIFTGIAGSLLGRAGNQET